jgi:hypothetical protein
MTSRSPTAAPILAALAIVTALVGGYASAYLLMSERWELMARDAPGVEAIERLFKQQWLCTAFAPAAWVEEKFIGLPVVLRSAGRYHEAVQPGMPPTPSALESSAYPAGQ